MLNGIRQIFGKEMSRILRDKKMVFSVFLLPVIIMVVLLTIINSLAGQMQSDIEEHKAIVWMQNEPDSFEAFLASSGMEYDVRTVASDSDRAKAEDQILNVKADQIVMLGLLLVALAFLYSAVVALISVFAKTTKEASSYIMPVYMVVLVAGLLTMFRMGDGSPWDYYIPFYNSAIALQAILSHDLTISQYLVTLVETLALGGILTVLIARAFNNEKVMAL